MHPNDFSSLQSPFLRELAERGFIQQLTHMEALDQYFMTPGVAYLGFDCTAPSLHVGSLMQIMILRKLQQHGHKPVVLVGGGTTRIGDPSGRDESRKMLTDEVIQENVNSIAALLSHFIDFNSKTGAAELVNNADWLLSLGYLDFLRDFGTLFSVNRMLSMDSVAMRLERQDNLSFLEFNYMLLQAYDFLWLNDNKQCRVQIGGGDQWGNIVMGIELCRRLQRPDCYGMTTPLLTTASGAKMGKSVAGAIWLTKTMVSSYDFWQYWRNSDDRDVGRFLRIFTELPLDEIAELEQAKGAALNDVKKRLATEVTALCHSRDEALEAQEAATRLFENNEVSEKVPTLSIARDILHKGIPLIELLVMASLATSKAEARKLVRSQAVRINDNIQHNELTYIDTLHYNDEGIKLSVGKKRHIRLIIVE